MKKVLMIATLAAAFATTGAQAQDNMIDCAEINWSAQVLAKNPDIGEACQGVYERNGKLFAKAQIEITRARGNRLSFRPMHTDGTQGKARSVTLPSSWRAKIEGQTYRAGDLLPGQQLDVYLPEDRFALAVDDGDFGGDEELVMIEEVVMAAMPKTASPLFAILAGGLSALGLGGLMTFRRRSKA